MVKILFFIFISSNLIYHIIILDFEFQVSKCNVLDVLFYCDDMQMKIYFFGLEYFIIMLFVVFSLSPLKVIVCNLDFNILVYDCILFKLFKSKGKKLGR